MIKLVVIDFDSTLMDGETIDLLAEPAGVADEVSAITEQAMQGDLDFFESLSQRVKLLKGLPESEANQVFQSLPYMPGAAELVARLKEKKMRVIVFSGGFRPATSKARNDLGFDADFANILHLRDGALSGLVGGDMMFSDSKGDMMQRLQRLLDIQPQETMAVGDGANDLSMFEFARTRVAFCAKPALQAAATHKIDVKDLTAVLGCLD